MNNFSTLFPKTQIIKKDIDFTKEVYNDLKSRAISKGFRMSDRKQYFYTDNETKRRKSFTEEWSKGDVVVELNFYTVY